MREATAVAVTHPSGWWKASDGNWYPPDQSPGDHREAPRDLLHAMGIAVTAVATHVLFHDGNVTLLFVGTAGAFLTRWWRFERPRLTYAANRSA